MKVLTSLTQGTILPRSPGYEGRQRPSVYEVAERAGVSIATVSRVLRGSAPVAPETRARVLDAARELRWRPSRLAQAFVKQANGAVGIVFPDLAGPYYSRVIAGFEHEVVERKAAALILGTHGKAEVEHLVLDLADRVDGLVIMGRTVSNEFVSSLDRSDTPVVLLARPPVGDVPAVRSASLASAEVLTEHVLAHGRRRVAFLGEPDLSPDTSERWRGVHKVLRRHGIDTSSVVVPCGGFDVEHGYKTGLEVLADPQRFDAVICVNDEVASGVYRAAATVGRPVPDDVAITGWDDTAMAARLHPPLTTVRQPMRDLGARAAARLFDRIDGKAVSSVVLRTSVVVRQSCGCDGRAMREKPRGPEAGSQPTTYQSGRDGRPT